MPLDFPANPIQGQVYNNFYFDATTNAWRSVNSSLAPSALKNVTFGTAAAGSVPVTVQGITSQSANLQEWKDVSGTVLANIDSSGNLTNTQTTSTNIYSTNLYLNRQNTASEGGQINLRRASDNTDYWFIDAYGNTSTPSLRMLASSQVNMTIDASGRVMMPFQPAFSVQGTGTQAWSGAAVSTKVVMNGTVFVNRGSYYSTANSRFTAPVAGVYQFHMSSAITTNSTGPEISVYKNGVVVVTNLAIGYDALYNTFGGSCMLDLSANDYIEMYITNNNGVSFTIDRGRSIFSGSLIG